MSKEKVKFTFIDLIIILVVLAAVVFAAVKIIPSMIESDKEAVSFTVMLQSKDEGFAKAISEGDNVTISLTEKDGGVVKKVETEPAKAIAFNSIDGMYSNEIIKDKYDVYVTIEAQTDVSELAIKTGDTAIKVGAEIPVRGKGYASSGYIIEIED